jgi:hypothetical protein
MLLVAAVGCDVATPVTMAPIEKPPIETDATFVNGNYSGTGHTSSNGCGLNADVTVTGSLDVNKAGQGSWQKIHVSAGGVIFRFNIQVQVISATSATFTATTFAQDYTITDTGTLADSTVLTVTQQFTKQGASCKTVYNMTLRKQ